MTGAAVLPQSLPQHELPVVDQVDAIPKQAVAAAAATPVQGQRAESGLVSGDILSSKWLLLERVGRGAFGDIFIAESIVNSSSSGQHQSAAAAAGQKVAIKIERLTITPPTQQSGTNTSKQAPPMTVEEQQAALHAASSRAVLKLEAVILSKLQSHAFVARFIEFGRDLSRATSPTQPTGPAVAYLVMTLLGENLLRLRRLRPSHRFTLSTALRIGISGVEALRRLHEKGFLHRDVKPSNWVIGRHSLYAHIKSNSNQNRSETSSNSTTVDEDDYIQQSSSSSSTTLENNKKEAQYNNTSTVYMIDFGLARAYTDRRSSSSSQLTLLPQRLETQGFRGTPRYASIHVHRGTDLCRRDDLISLLYCLVEFVVGDLPWGAKRDKTVIGRIKEKYDANCRLVRKLPSCFTHFMRHLHELQFESEPNYDYLQSVLQEKLDRMQQQHGSTSLLFDWEQPPLHNVNTMTTADHTLVDVVAVAPHANDEQVKRLTPRLQQQQSNVDEQPTGRSPVHSSPPSSSSSVAKQATTAAAVEQRIVRSDSFNVDSSAGYTTAAAPARPSTLSEVERDDRSASMHQHRSAQSQFGGSPLTAALDRASGSLNMTPMKSNAIGQMQSPPTTSVHQSPLKLALQSIQRQQSKLTQLNEQQDEQSKSNSPEQQHNSHSRAHSSSAAGDSSDSAVARLLQFDDDAAAKPSPTTIVSSSVEPAMTVRLEQFQPKRQQVTSVNDVAQPQQTSTHTVLDAIRSSTTAQSSVPKAVVVQPASSIGAIVAQSNATQQPSSSTSAASPSPPQQAVSRALLADALQLLDQVSSDTTVSQPKQVNATALTSASNHPTNHLNTSFIDDAVSTGTANTAATSDDSLSHHQPQQRTQLNKSIRTPHALGGGDESHTSTSDFDIAALMPLRDATRAHHANAQSVDLDDDDDDSLLNEAQRVLDHHSSQLNGQPQQRSALQSGYATPLVPSSLLNSRPTSGTTIMMNPSSLSTTSITLPSSNMASQSSVQTIHAPSTLAPRGRFIRPQFRQALQASREASRQTSRTASRAPSGRNSPRNNQQQS